MDTLRFPKLLEQIDQFGIGPGGIGLDDFPNYVSGDWWTSVISDAGSVAVGDGVGGLLVVTAGGGVSNNDEAYVKSTNALFNLLAHKPMYCAGTVLYTEVVAGNLALFFGFASAVAADFIADGGAALRTSGSFIGLVKFKGDLVWSCASRNNGILLTNKSLTPAGGTTAQFVEVDVQDMGDGTNVIVSYLVNKIPLRDTNTSDTIKHKIAVASPTIMQMAFGSKLGADTNSDLLTIDYVAGIQKR